jgi:uncharacterized protein YdeI (YjbR/CyaY-like superfamily)
MPISNPSPIFFSSPAELRAWLEANHESAGELWVGCYRKRTGIPSVTWPELVDEALCVGWIDGIRKTVDDQRWTIRLTPRRPRSNWSLVNLKRVPELIAAGRMLPAGLRAYEAREEERTGIYSFEQREAAKLDDEAMRRLQSDAAAWEFFQSRPPSYRKGVTWWIVSARKPETRAKRLATLIQESCEGRTIGALTAPSKRAESK